MKKKEITFDDVYDKFAIRVILDSPLEKEGNRIDLMYGVKVGWVLPLYKKKPAPYYLY